MSRDTDNFVFSLKYLMDIFKDKLKTKRPLDKIFVFQGITLTIYSKTDVSSGWEVALKRTTPMMYRTPSAASESRPHAFSSASKKARESSSIYQGTDSSGKKL